MDKVGEAVGLAWSPHGSQLVHLSASVAPGKGKIHIQGEIGYEALASIETAIESLKFLYGISTEDLTLSIKIDEPLEGPSAGLALLVAIYSAINNLPVDQSAAITGVVTNKGRVHSVMKITEKVALARDKGLKGIVIPSENLYGQRPSLDFGEMWVCPVARAQDAVSIVVANTGR
tara:strand:+ start:10016 stop:10540 length:525 start_codon:yes stop_codon:yes gene_type:complete